MSIPPNTAVPSDTRLAAPAPEDSTSGTHAQDEGEGGHQDRPQAQMRRLNGGLANRLALSTLLRRELDDQNSIFGDQTHQQDQANAGVDVVGRATVPHKQHGAEHAQWYAEDDAQRHGASSHTAPPVTETPAQSRTQRRGPRAAAFFS